MAWFALACIVAGGVLQVLGVRAVFAELSAIADALSKYHEAPRKEPFSSSRMRARRFDDGPPAATEGDLRVAVDRVDRLVARLYDSDGITKRRNAGLQIIAGIVLAAAGGAVAMLPGASF